jgi:hypothetical protein
MTNYCSCKDKDGTMLGMFPIDNCSQCSLEFCTKNLPDTTMTDCSSDAPIFGLSVALFLTIVIIQIVIWLIMIFFSVAVYKKCKNKPNVRVAIVTLLILWIIFSWIPFFGFVLFIVLLVILIVYNNECKKKK